MMMELPLDYFDELRAASIPFETRDGSAVVAALVENEDIRLGHITSLLPISLFVPQLNQTRYFTGPVVSEAAILLAMKHFNDRNPIIIQGLDERLKDCNIHLTLEYRDTQASPIQASRQFLQAVNDVAPIGLIGAALNSVSTPLAILSGVYEIPQITPLSAGYQLENKDVYPYFARTIPTSRGAGKSLVLYLFNLGVTHFGIFYPRDVSSVEWVAYISQEAKARGMVAVPITYVDTDVMTSMDSAAARLKESGLRYFIGGLNHQTSKEVLERMYANGIIGNRQFVWLFSTELANVAEPRYALEVETESNIASAINGIGIAFHIPPANANLKRALDEMFANETMLQYFVSRHAEPEPLDSLNLSAIPTNQYFQKEWLYDALMALGIAACEVESDDFFTGPQLYEQLKQTEFWGASGLVSFDRHTGTRKEETIVYQIVNVIANPPNEQGMITVTTRQSAVIANVSSNFVQELNPHIYWDGTTIPPLVLPVVDHELNLMGTGVRAVGLTLAGLVMVISVAWFVWTAWNRNLPVVQASQPVFLAMLCVGTFVMSSSVIPSSLQEPVSKSGLDIACMATLWLFSIGFVTSFSALFSKTWRLNKVYKMSRACRRGRIEVKDVLIPFLVLMTLNIIILAIWTIVSPLVWTRVETSSVDRFGRSTESYGTCYELDQASQYVFLAMLVVVNFVPLLFAIYQTYKSRNLPPSNFNESRYIAISLLSLLEAFLLSVPLFFLVSDVPSADFIVESVFVTIISLAILLPLLVPKYVNRNENPRASFVSRRVSLTREGAGQGGSGELATGELASIHPSVRNLLRRRSSDLRVLNE